MKKINRIIISFIILFSWGCDKNFDSINTNPNTATADVFNPGFLFTRVQMQTFLGGGDEGFVSNMMYFSTFVQHFTTLYDEGFFAWYGDKYVYRQDANDVLWNHTYNVSKFLQDVIEQKKEDNDNLYQMARIWKVILFQRLTDAYGDVPYSEASLAFYQQIKKPKYDTQEFIYKDMLATLKDAVAKLDAGTDNFAKFDIVYKGDIAKWKKLGNSLMLRLGMRLTKVDIGEAEKWVKDAISGNGGLMSSNDDNLVLRGTDGGGVNASLIIPWAPQYFRGVQSGSYISATLFDYMDTRNDPRLFKICAIYPSTTSDPALDDRDPAHQKGLPSGWGELQINNIPNYDPSNPLGMRQWSDLNRSAFAKFDGPRFLMTNAQVQLLLSEAALRGWGGDAKDLYEKGVRADMENYSNYDSDVAITTAEITGFLNANPFVGTVDFNAALNQISGQYWLACFLNGYEAFANWRRTDYPDVIIPTNYQVNGNETNGKRPGRLKYQADEPRLNAENYQAAVQKQGPDEFITKVWWEKP
ncbi:MAG: SusD/RagB family nutrient-binding outer membrane lipoprotein [Chitinophagaceae bacterium]|nr:SusD/RagB family nutrient-binding outer membrane lipoprotein [Chitinophagaceae bacterium]